MRTPPQQLAKDAKDPGFAKRRKLGEVPFLAGFPSSQSVGKMQPEALASARRANGNSTTA